MAKINAKIGNIISDGIGSKQMKSSPYSADFSVNIIWIIIGILIGVLVCYLYDHFQSKPKDN